jgi:hypothetical protein
MKSSIKKLLSLVITIIFIIILMTNFAFAEGTVNEEAPRKILNIVISWCTVIAMIILVIYLIRDIIAVVKGNGSIGNIIIKILCVFLLVGVMIFTRNFDGSIFAKPIEEAIDVLPTTLD